MSLHEDTFILAMHLLDLRILGLLLTDGLCVKVIRWVCNLKYIFTLYWFAWCDTHVGGWFCRPSCFSLGLSLVKEGWRLTDAAETAIFQFANWLWAEKGTILLWLRGEEGRGMARDGRGSAAQRRLRKRRWVELLLIRNPFLGPGANSVTHFNSHINIYTGCKGRPHIKHCQRHNGPRYCLTYLSSYKAGKFSRKENSTL